ncbi:MAG TPA: hypothetical protein VH482_02140 [Thermomicrobiales bacterium]|jgi:hypothetical protein
MEPTAGQLTCRPGDEVIGSDDHKIGKLVAFDANVLTVEHGLLSKGRYFIPTSAVNACSDGKVYLNVTKDAAGHAGWETPPAISTDAGNPPGTPVV